MAGGKLDTFKESQHNSKQCNVGQETIGGSEKLGENLVDKEK